MTEARVGKMPATRGPALDLLFEPLVRVGAADLATVAGREGQVGEQVGLGLDQQPGDGPEARSQAVDHPAELVARRGLVGLLEDRPDGRGDHAPGTARDEVPSVA
jgi:hypothetical protein